MQRNRHILIVDDDSLLSTLLSIYIRSTLPDTALTVVVNGSVALEAHAQAPADLIITDYQMPDMDGLTLVRNLRTFHDQTPIIMWSGTPDMETNALGAGANIFVSKSGELEQVIKAIKALLLLE